MKTPMSSDTETHEDEEVAITESQHQATVQEGRVVVQNVQGRQNRGQGNNARGAGVAGYGVGAPIIELGMQYPVNALDEDYVNEQPVQDLALNVDNVFNTQGCMDDGTTKLIVDSHADYTSDGNMILYDQYVKDNAVSVVQSNVSSVPNDAYMMILNVIYEQSAVDLIKIKAEALKVQTTASRPIKALMMYPTNTPATLVPKHDEIEQKNLLITNDNLIADCLSKEVFYIATNSELNVSRFTEMHDAYTIVQARCLKLEAELSNLSDKVQIQNKKICVTKDSVTPKVLSPGRYAIDIEPIPLHNRKNREVHLEYLKHLKESVETLREIVEEAKVERPLDRSLVSACLYTKHSQELLEYVIGTCPKDFNKRDKKHVATPLTRKKQVTFANQFEMTVRFGNDHFGAIMGYGDYVIGDSVISRVYYVEGLGHNLFSVRQFCNSDLEVAFRKHFCYVRDTDGVELIKGSRVSNFDTISFEDL
ncbi:hypothetical protein Tco_0401459 [Tanacetum coccineum]